jgi:microcystin-dependent protein
VHGNVGSGHLFYETTGTTDPIPKTLATDSVTNANNSQTPTDPHNNIQPCLALAYVICTNGLFPQSN